LEEEAEYFPRRKTSFTFTDFPVRYSSTSDLSSKIEPLSGSPKRTRLQALESEGLEFFAGRALVGRERVTCDGCAKAALAYERGTDS
jgi:hypothetical protein